MSQPATVTRRPGRARLSVGDYRAAESASRFRGLPPGVTHPKQLLEPLRAAGRHLPFRRCALDTLAYLVDRSNPQDWKAGGRPVVFPGNARICQATGVTVATVNRDLRELRRAAAIKMEYGPGNRRQPVRDSRGEIVELYGIDLSPLVELYARMVEVVRHQTERANAIRSIVNAIRNRIDLTRQHEDAAVCAGAGTDAQRRQLSAWTAHAEALGREAKTLQRRDHLLQEEEQSAQLARFADIDIEARLVESQARALADALLCKDSEEKSICPRLPVDSHNTTSPSHSQESVLYGLAGGEAAEPVDKSPVRRPDTGDRTAPEDALLFPFVPMEPTRRPAEPRWSGALLARISPSFVGAIRTYRPRRADPSEADAADLVTVGRILGIGFGLSDVAWSRAVERHGEIRSALCALVVAERPLHEIRTSRAALLAGMFLKRPEDLNPLASLFGLAGRRAAASAQSGAAHESTTGPGGRFSGYGYGRGSGADGAP